MDTITNSSFNKNPMAQELIHSRLLHPYKSAMKAMCRHWTLLDSQKLFQRKTLHIIQYLLYIKNEYFS